MKRPASSDGRNVYPVGGWTHDSATSPAMLYAPTLHPVSEQSHRPYFHLHSSYIHDPYAVTPISSNFPASMEKKRRRLLEETPLVAGYHHPMTHHGTPTERRHPASFQGTPNVSLLYSSPPNPRKQGFAHTPPPMTHKTVLPPQEDQVARATSSNLKPKSFSSNINPSFPSPSVSQSCPTTQRAAAGQPSGESSDCWINDLNQFQTVASAEQLSQLKSAARRQSLGSGGGSDFDPFNDDLLSDSEHNAEGAMSPYPFFCQKRDSI